MTSTIQNLRWFSHWDIFNGVVCFLRICCNFCFSVEFKSKLFGTNQHFGHPRSGSCSCHSIQICFRASRLRFDSGYLNYFAETGWTTFFLVWRSTTTAALFAALQRSLISPLHCCWLLPAVSSLSSGLSDCFDVYWLASSISFTEDDLVFVECFFLTYFFRLLYVRRVQHPLALPLVCL